MFIIIRIILDVIFVISSFIISYLIRFDSLTWSNFLSAPIHQYSNYLLAITIVYVLSFNFFSMYKTKKGFLLYLDELIGVFLTVLFASSILIVLTFINGEYQLARPIIFLSVPVALILLALSRELVLRIEIVARSKGFGGKRAAIIGSGELAQTVADKIRQHPSYGINFAGFIGDGNKEVLGNIDELESIVARYNIQTIYVADKAYTRERLAELADFCDQKNIVFGTIPDVFQILTNSPSVEDIDGLPIVTLRQTKYTMLSRVIKRVFDVVLSLFGIIIFFIPMILIYFLIKFTSQGVVIYAQARVGRNGKPFKLYKFRTMISGAEHKTGPVLATDDDTRKTPIGKILRATNLDELPQLFNILKGDMSFVGPRPERPFFVEQFRLFIPKYMERHKIRPGLAGWAQFHGGYNMPAEEKIKYDLYYIENWSFLLDIKIILSYLWIAFTLQRRN